KDSIARWLLRPTASLGVRPVAQAAAVVGSSRGRVRTENQDKAVVASFESDDPRKNFRVFLVCDGLGGMREGERCAAEAIAHFICDLVHTASISDRSERLRSAIAYTNSELWKIFNERGGTTIAAILLTDTGATAVAVGDTRIYKHGEKGDRSEEHTSELQSR